MGEHYLSKFHLSIKYRQYQIKGDYFIFHFVIL